MIYLHTTGYVRCIIYERNVAVNSQKVKIIMYMSKYSVCMSCPPCELFINKRSYRLLWMFMSFFRVDRYMCGMDLWNGLKFLLQNHKLKGIVCRGLCGKCHHIKCKLGKIIIITIALPYVLFKLKKILGRLY